MTPWATFKKKNADFLNFHPKFPNCWNFICGLMAEIVVDRPKIPPKIFFCHIVLPKTFWAKSDHYMLLKSKKSTWSQKGPFGGSTFWISRACNGRIFVKFFLVKQWGKRIFLVEFLANRPKFRPHSHKWNFKSWKNGGLKICIFFTRIGLKVSHHASKKQKIF